MSNAALLALSFDTQAEVTRFAEAAKQNGGDYYQIDTGVPADMMLGYEVIDPDGHHWEPVWMAPSFDPQATA